MPIRQTRSLNGIQVSYLEWPSVGVPLLLLHGLADHALVWSELGEALSQNYHVVAVDMRGHGESSKPAQGYAATDVIGDLEALMDCLGWSSAHILGHSWTGKVAIIWATRRPERFRSLILVDPIFVYGLPEIFRVTFPLFYQILPFLKGMGPFGSFPQAVEKAKTLKQYREWTPLQEAVFTASLEQKPDGRWGSKFTIAARNGIFEDVLKVPGLTEPIEVPTLFVQPEAGVNRYDWQLKPYKRYLKNLTLQSVPGNHWAFLGEPVAFNQTVETFLATNTVQTGPSGDDKDNHGNDGQ
ncbi:MAG TPA: alpha/beta hydrolase [Leptolyngbyaceae cyanobacterium]